MARGTGEQPANESKVAVASAPRTVDEWVQELLTRATHSDDALAGLLQRPLAEVRCVLAKLANANRLANVGSPECPEWTWRIGDQASTADLTDEVLRLLMERPMSAGMLADATGVPLARVDRLFTQLLGSPQYKDRLVPSGAEPDGQKLWLLLPDGMSSTALPQREFGDQGDGGSPHDELDDDVS